MRVTTSSTARILALRAMILAKSNRSWRISLSILITSRRFKLSSTMRMLPLGMSALSSAIASLLFDFNIHLLVLLDHSLGFFDFLFRLFKLQSGFFDFLF